MKNRLGHTIELNNDCADVSFVTDANFLILDASDTVKRNFGVLKKNILGKNFLELFSVSETDINSLRVINKRLWKGVLNFILKDESYSCFVIIEKKNGSGNENFIIKIFILDTNEVYIEKNDSFNEFIDSFNGFYSIITHNAGKETVFYSNSVKRIVGYEPHELEEMPGRLLSLVHKDDIGNLIKARDEYLKAPDKSRFEIYFRLIHKNGSLIWLKENVLLRTDKINSSVRIILNYVDITDIKEKLFCLEDEVKSLKDEINSKDKFISLLAHELRAPFTSILGFSEILINDFELPEKEKAEYLNYIYESSQKQLELVNYLLDYSRLRTGSIKLEKQRIKIAPLIFTCISALTGSAVRKNIEIKSFLDDNIYVFADEKLLYQSILNLLNNAIKFSFENSTVEILSSKFNKDFAEVIVKDNGQGLNQEEQNKIFTLEKNFSKEGTKGEKGSGLGLALVREIIEKHNGEIWFYSDEGKGTEFHFTVPLSENSILIVEPDSIFRNSIIKIIKSVLPDFKIFYCKNSYDALDFLTNKIPSLLIIKHNLPLMNGLQLYESLNTSGYKMKIPFITLLEENERMLEESYSQAGIQKIFVKPFDNDEFVKALMTILN